MNDRQKKIAQLCDGTRRSTEIAEMLGDNAKYVQRTMLKFDLPRRNRGGQKGKDNGSWKSGRHVDLDGYVTVPCPEGMRGRAIGRILEHRMVMAQKIGRDLRPEEVVDHIDGLHLHNAPSNLRLFSSNAEHLKATISGRIPSWSKEGLDRMNSGFARRLKIQQVDTYHQRKANGDVRLQQILLAALSLGTDSPYLLGTHHLLEKAGIDWTSRTSLQHALDGLCLKYA